MTVDLLRPVGPIVVAGEWFELSKERTSDGHGHGIESPAFEWPRAGLEWALAALHPDP